MNTEADVVTQLRRELDAAAAAAGNAYRHSTQLIQLLTVLGQPSSPEALVEQTLIVLSQVYAANVVAIVRVVADRVIMTSSWGLAEGDPTLQVGWPAAGGIMEAIAAAGPVERIGDALRAEDIPPSMADMSFGAGVWIPLGPETGTGELLLLLRSGCQPLAPTELHVLQSVTVRLGAAVEARKRSVAIERLARSGHRLAKYTDATALTREAVDLLRQLVDADAAHVVILDGSCIREHTASDGAGTALPPDLHDATRLPGWAEALGGEPFRGVCRDGTPLGAPDGGPSAMLCVPVILGRTPVALLYATRDARHPFPPDASEIASIFANYFGAAMMNAELYRALRSSENELRERATHDPLTTLANRALLCQRLEEALARDTGSKTGLLFCDLDKFKQVNDRLGHHVGDELLTNVAQRLHRGMRGNDLLARFGGDEFVALIDDAEGLEELHDVGRRLVELVEAPFTLQGERVEISMSVGGVLGSPGISSATGMLRDADAAMYAAKRLGSGRVEIFDEAASSHSLDRLKLRSDLHSALHHGQLWLQYQPIVDLTTGGVGGFEALLRWNHPERGAITPAVFIPLAEESGAITPIGDWVLSEACRQLAEWHRLPGRTDLEISVNVSPIQLRHPAVADRTLTVVRQAGVRPRHVWLEITERGSIDPEITRAAGRLHEAGFRFALDDFGVAQSNLNHLKQLPIDQLKIERSFVGNVTTSAIDRGIVRAVLTLADTLGVCAVAEGIETREQQIALTTLGCRHGQGYLLSRPLSAARATALLLRGAPAAPTALAG